MSEGVTVMDGIESSLDELKNKLTRLTAELCDAEARKKAANAGFNAEIKDYREMIKMTLQEIKRKESET